MKPFSFDGGPKNVEMVLEKMNIHYLNSHPTMSGICMPYARITRELKCILTFFCRSISLVRVPILKGETLLVKILFDTFLLHVVDDDFVRL